MSGDVVKIVCVDWRASVRGSFCGQVETFFVLAVAWVCQSVDVGGGS